MEIIDTYLFQFLWGWNAISYKKSVKLQYYNLQFLWGWNMEIKVKANPQPKTLSIPLRMKLYTSPSPGSPWLGFQFLWGWNNARDRYSVSHDKSLSIPLRMKPDFQFTYCAKIHPFQFLWGWNIYIYPSSLNAVKAFNSFEDETPTSSHEHLQRKNFQFLWGWNIFRGKEDGSSENIVFQFLWGWNPREELIIYLVVGV